MKNIKQLLDAKGHVVWSIAPEATVFEAIELMADKRVGALAVVTDELLVGVVSERDYARKVILKGRSSRETRVSEIMTSRVVVTSPVATVEECMALMSSKGVRHLPVLEGTRLVGMISIRDLVSEIIAEQQFKIEELERYIGT